MQLNSVEKRWLEINCYLLCNKIYQNNNNYNDIEDFFKGFRWTNLYNYDILIKSLRETNLLFNTSLQPSKYEFALCLQASKRFKYSKKALIELAKPANYFYYGSYLTKIRLQEEIKEEKTIILPKIKIKKFHETYYSFLLAARYHGDLFTKELKL